MPSMLPWSASGDPAAGDHPRQRRRLRPGAVPGLPDPDLHPRAPELDPAHALQPLPARRGRLRRGGHQSLPEHVSALPAADRWGWLRARPEPDPGDHPAADRAGRGGRADSRLSSPQVSEAIAAWRRALGACGAVVLVDQVTKAIVVSSLA